MQKYYRILGAVALSCLVLILVTITIATIVEFMPRKGPAGKERVVVVEVEGMMLDLSTDIRKIEKLTEEDSVKSVVLRINSPGGLVGPAEELYRAVRKLDEKKPVIVSLGPVAASGGYYVACAGRKIFSNEGSLTGSIGVIMEFMNASRLYDWMKIRRYVIKAGKFKDIGSTIRAMNPDERQFLVRLVNDIHASFRKIVQERRNLTPEELDQVADGRVITGKQAHAAKLVDQIGGMAEAVAEAKSVAGLSEDTYVQYPKTRVSLFEQVFLKEKSDISIDSLASLLKKADIPNLNPGWRIMMLAPVR